MKHVALPAAALSLVFTAVGGAQASLLAPAETSPFDVGAASGQVLLADIDRDGRVDLLTGTSKPVRSSCTWARGGRGSRPARRSRSTSRRRT